MLMHGHNVWTEISSCHVTQTRPPGSSRVLSGSPFASKNEMQDTLCIPLQSFRIVLSQLCAAGARSCPPQLSEPRPRPQSARHRRARPLGARQTDRGILAHAIGRLCELVLARAKVALAGGGEARGYFAIAALAKGATGVGLARMRLEAD
jgi:hypothetical protein